MKRALLAGSILVTSILGLAGWIAAQTPPEKGEVYSVVLFAHNLMVPMRDGIHLAADVYRPAVDGVPLGRKLPILLQQTPYNKEGGAVVDQARYLASHGYVVVLQDDRGAYQSEGVLVKYVGFGNDAWDTIEWLAQQPYTDGQVGMYGTSYAAHAAASAAIVHPPHLKTVVINCGGLSNGWEYKIRNHGAFELAQQLAWAFDQAAANPNNKAAQEMMKHEKVADWVGQIHSRRGNNPLTTAKNFEDYLFELMTHGDYDAYWKNADMNWSLNYEQTADIPMMNLTGWYDSYTSGSIKNYAALSKIKKGPQRLVVGPWLHGRNTSSVSGDVEFGPDAAIADFANSYHIRWFDHFLKGQNSINPGDDSPVRLFVMGTGDGHKDANGHLYHGGFWRAANAWPLPESKPTAFYFQSDGSLSTQAPLAGGGSTTYTYDPKHPVPTIGGSFTSQRGLVAAGGWNQREREFRGDPATGYLGSAPPFLPLRARDDVLVFQTAALDRDVEVTGPVEVTLYAASTALDTDFTAKLVDVYPPSKDYPAGYDLNITDGIIRARYRNSPENQELMRPGEVYKIRVEPFPTANVFKKGHRIRVDISSSNFPRFDVNPNSGEPLGRSRRTVVADNTILHDAAHPSQILLSLVEPRGSSSAVAGK